MKDRQRWQSEAEALLSSGSAIAVPAITISLKKQPIECQAALMRNAYRRHSCHLQLMQSQHERSAYRSASASVANRATSGASGRGNLEPQGCSNDRPRHRHVDPGTAITIIHIQLPIAARKIKLIGYLIVGSSDDLAGVM